jgi:predicted RNA binding protein YcfA (HicA-like mRNA interferase family)
MPVGGKQMLDKFIDAGWEFLRQRGSHVVIGKGIRRAVIPMHKELGRGLELELLKTLRNSKDEEVLHLRSVSTRESKE